MPPVTGRRVARIAQFREIDVTTNEIDEKLKLGNAARTGLTMIYD